MTVTKKRILPPAPDSNTLPNNVKRNPRFAVGFSAKRDTFPISRKKWRIPALLAAWIALLFPLSVSAAAPESAYTEKPVIVLDPGHGGMDGGTTAGIRYEKTYNLLLSQYLRDALTEHGGFEVVLTREDDDTDLEFLPRAWYIITNNADLLLSLHCNSSDIASASGALAITSVIEKYSAFDLGESILTRISESVGIKNRGVETRLDTGDSLGVYYWSQEMNWDMPAASYLQTVSDYFSINTWSSKFGVPSLIIEHGYLSNDSDREILDKDENLKKFAQAEADALIDYYYGHTHVFTDEKVTDFPSNCSMNGTKSYHCTICGLKADTESLPPAPDAHFYRQNASRLATCEEDGYIEYICQISNNLNEKGYATPVHTFTEHLEKKGHAYRVIEDTAAGHGIDGRHVEYCNNCGDTIETIIPGDPHQYEASEQTDPTCETEGGVTYRCTVCGDSYVEPIPALGHSFDENEICTVCGFDAKKPPEKTNPPETEPDEEETGGDGRCIHQFEIVSTTEPTCEEDGEQMEQCSLCGEKTTTVLPALGHDDIVSLDTPATCETNGFYRARCRRCAREVIENRPATGHTFVTEAENKEERRQVCTVCGASIILPMERRSLKDMMTSPWFLILCAILAAQAVLLLHTSLRRRQRMKHQLLERKAQFWEESTDAVSDETEQIEVAPTETAPPDVVPDKTNSSETVEAFSREDRLSTFEIPSTEPEEPEEPDPSKQTDASEKNAD